MEKKLCPKCHRELEANMAFCIYCGEPQAPKEEPFRPEPAKQPWQPQEEPFASTRRADPFRAEPAKQPWQQEEAFASAPKEEPFRPEPVKQPWQQENYAQTYRPEPTTQQWPRPEEPVRTQNSYPTEPAQTTYSVAQPVYQAEKGSGLGWIIFMRVLLWLVFAVGAVAATLYGIDLIDYGFEAEGIAVIVGGILSAFIVVGGGMVALNSASNARKTANNTAKILKLLQDRRQ